VTGASGQNASAAGRAAGSDGSTLLAAGSGGTGTHDDDAGVAAGTDATASGPLVLPEPDVLGPYEVVLEKNVGVGYENEPTSGDVAGSTSCNSFVASFGQDPAKAADFAKIPDDLDIKLYSLYRPKFEEGKTYPLLTWGNGTCALPEGYGPLLRHVVSHGFIVIAANSRYVGVSSQPMKKALDWALKANDDPASSLYKKIDPEKIGAFGHSQGAGATVTVAQDPRIKTTVPLNGSGSGLNEPTFLVTGDMDINPNGIRSAFTNLSVPAAFIHYHMIPGGGMYAGHLTLITQPQRVVGPVTAWFRYQLQSDPVARDWFTGATCKLCNRSSEFDFMAKDLE
jgi:hypothetical protein